MKLFVVQEGDIILKLEIHGIAEEDVSRSTSEKVNDALEGALFDRVLEVLQDVELVQMRPYVRAPEVRIQ